MTREALIADTDCAPDFSSGWAMQYPGDDQRFHWWTRHADGLFGYRLCKPGVVPLMLANGQPGLFVQGNFPRCARCDAMRANPRPRRA